MRVGLPRLAMPENRLSMVVEGAPDVGALLKAARERRGVSLKQVAEATKISVLALDALERNDLSHLPGGIFTRAFVRAYAREVGLDIEQTVRQFVEQFPTEDPSVAERPSRPISHNGHLIGRDGRLWRLAARVVTVVVFLAAVVAYLAWSGRLASWRQGQTGGAVTAETAAVRPRASAPPAGTSLPGRDVAAQTPPLPAEPSMAPTAALASEQAAPLSTPVEEAGVRPAPAAIPEGTLRIALAPRAPCWVSLRVDGEPVFSGLMNAGDVREVDVRGTVMLTAGDAGAFAFSVNGVTGRSLGGPGQVVTVVLTAQNYTKYLSPQ